MTRAFSHGAIFFIRDYNPEQNEDNVLARMLDHKEAILSHLSWASLFLGFHTLGLYVQNDVMLAFGTPEKEILIEPIFAQCILSAHGKTSYGFNVLLSSTTGPAFNELIETLAWDHEHTPLANLILWRGKPVALSIVQARLVGLAHFSLQSLPRNTAPTRLHRRCFLTGRPRANYQDFGLSEHTLREMVHACLLPGATRSCW
ncbi:hypothetical protein MTR67_031456 [Solanum verrucosum]|uniref:Uncharacterized protein n=1 Tax=Solanum verrucosum TaxID=315347 RepID=A0AAF0ZDT1_SOLVR|nr:hypothetical protein MTR67_031456 [Solanum verrucosum]